MTRLSLRRPLAVVDGAPSRRWAVLACGAALGVSVLAGCNAGNGDSQTGTDSTPGPPLPSVELPKNPELSPPFGVQRSSVNPETEAPASGR